MDSFKHKITYIIITAVATYFGFQALDLISGIYQVGTFFAVAWYIYFFHIFWLVFVFDLHFKTSGHLGRARTRFQGWEVFWQAFQSRARHLYHWSYVKTYLNYLILPSIFYWSVVILIHLNPFHELFKDGLIIISTVALSVVYWYFKYAFSQRMEHHHTGLKILSLCKLLAAFLGLTAIFALGWYYGISLSFLMPMVFIIVFLLVYQALYQRGSLKSHVYPKIFLFAILMGLVFAAIFTNWNHNYYTAGLMAAAIYTTSWEILHRMLEKTLTRALLLEFVFMLVLMLSVILSTHDFQGRI